MVESMSLSGRADNVPQRIVSGTLLLIFPFFLAIFPGLCIVDAQSPWGIRNQRQTLQFICQSVSNENQGYRFNLGKREEKFPVFSATIRSNKTRLVKFVLGEEKYRNEVSSFAISKTGFIWENFWLGFTTHGEVSYQTTHPELWFEPRAPPYIL